MTKPEQLAIIGLGRMGGGLALQAMERGMRVVGLEHGLVRDELVRAGLIVAHDMRELAASLAPPRAVLLYVPAGPTVDELLDELSTVLEPGDVIVDGGNSYWGDSIRRATLMRAHGLSLVDVGTSGGISGARHGACFMAGGDDEAVARVEPILVALAVPGGYVRAGRSGAGHFTKLVHNGIEFGMLQAIGEGIALLEAYRHELPVADIVRCWRSGSVIRSWLVDLLDEQYRVHGGLANVPPYVDDTGEVNWLVEDALHMDVPVPVIAQAVMELLRSRDVERAAPRAVALMRLGFGGHRLGRDERVVRERREGRIGGYVEDDEEHLGRRA